ncbi:MAG: SUMF1/EgtB/PvdO family nonheme iron enzyme [Bacteroidota bacterium]
MSPNISETDLEALWVSIPAGRVDMRDDRIQKAWSVDVAAFQLAKFPVTQALYQAVVGENPSTFQGDRLPVESVSWMEAVHFCNSLSEALSIEPCYTRDPRTQQISLTPKAQGIRLPSEAEWQYACQAGTRDIRYGALADIAWFKENAQGKPQAVGQKQANPWGLHDMLGNVWEWCSDVYDETVYGSYRVFRGGGWCDEARSVMATTRRRSHPTSFRIDDLGFRIAVNLGS